MIFNFLARRSRISQSQHTHNDDVNAVDAEVRPPPPRFPRLLSSPLMLIVAFSSPLAMDPRSRGGRRQSRRRAIGDGSHARSEAALTSAAAASAVTGVKHSPDFLLSVASPRPQRRRQIVVPPRILPPRPRGSPSGVAAAATPAAVAPAQRRGSAQLHRTS